MGAMLLQSALALIALCAQGNPGSMTDQDLAGAALARAERARERETRALEHAREARRRAEESTDPDAVEIYRREAKVHGRAAQVHHEAMEVQARHARDHS